MKITIRTLFILAALMVSASVHAQPVDGGDAFPSPGGSYSGSGGCMTCVVQGNIAECDTLRNDETWCISPTTGLSYPGCQYVSGYTSCTAHSVPSGYQGPPYCVVSGYCYVWQETSNRSTHDDSKFSAERQTEGIETFLRQSGVITDAGLNDFVAVTDFRLRGEPYAAATQKRLAAYRDEFNRLVARGDRSRELKPGDIPILPHKPTKAPTAVTASLSGE